MSNVQYNISPFNEFSLGSCFDEAYVAVFSGIVGSAYRYLLNRCTYFRYIEQYFCVSSYDIELREKIESEYGIRCECCDEQVDDIIQFALNKLNSGSYVMCRTSDAVAYNQRLKRKTQKSTSLHWLLIYGYNTETKDFNVLEHMTNVAAQYEPCLIKFDDLKSAYIAGCKYEEEGATVYSIYREKQKDNMLTDNFKLYQRKCKLIEDKLKLSIESLHRFLHELMESSHKIEQYDLTVLNEVVRYFEKELWIQHQAEIEIDKSKELLQKMYLVRTYCMKCLRREDEKTKTVMSNVCLEALECAEKWYQSLFGQVGI